MTVSAFVVFFRLIACLLNILNSMKCITFYYSVLSFLYLKTNDNAQRRIIDKQEMCNNRKQTGTVRQSELRRVGLVRASKTLLSLCEKIDIFPDTCIVRKVIVKLTFSYIVKMLR